MMEMTMILRALVVPIEAGDEDAGLAPRGLGEAVRLHRVLDHRSTMQMTTTEEGVAVPAAAAAARHGEVTLLRALLRPEVEGQGDITGRMT